MAEDNTLGVVDGAQTIIREAGDIAQNTFDKVVDSAEEKVGAAANQLSGAAGAVGAHMNAYFAQQASDRKIAADAAAAMEAAELAMMQSLPLDVVMKMETLKSEAMNMKVAADPEKPTPVVPTPTAPEPTKPQLAASAPDTNKLETVSVSIPERTPAAPVAAAPTAEPTAAAPETPATNSPMDWNAVRQSAMNVINNNPAVAAIAAKVVDTVTAVPVASLAAAGADALGPYVDEDTKKRMAHTAQQIQAQLAKLTPDQLTNLGVTTPSTPSNTPQIFGTAQTTPPTAETPAAPAPSLFGSAPTEPNKQEMLLKDMHKTLGEITSNPDLNNGEKLEKFNVAYEKAWKEFSGDGVMDAKEKAAFMEKYEQANGIGSAAEAEKMYTKLVTKAQEQVANAAELGVDAGAVAQKYRGALDQDGNGIDAAQKKALELSMQKDGVQDVAGTLSNIDKALAGLKLDNIPKAQEAGANGAETVTPAAIAAVLPAQVTAVGK